jgi:hypothetical protein
VISFTSLPLYTLGFFAVCLKHCKILKVCNQSYCHVTGSKYAECVQEEGLRKIFMPDREELGEDWGNPHNEEHHDLYSCQILLRCSNEERCDGRGMWHVGERRKMHTGFWWGNMKGRDRLKDVGIDLGIILR